ncbi:DNA gyrase subunit B [Anoxybacter fermentans]|uniref:DNA gyrase subunit B n=1 Tax=Anoxybacter fermentans TaxID=1323375 RepID=A0A3Q9HQY6_9FIRM|nr:DNA topoisomerase (ATP-hydrolyzing) subunit B [Anoxybacter fermentans]AZR72631.1 DNA gyrase subunit B [Anoxybacter fermentans]
MALFEEVKYDASQIQILEGLEAVRKRPGMYIGSTGTKGLHHLVWEVVDNSIDEHLAGYGNEIRVILNPDGSITVEDNGRGIPVDIHPDKGIPAAQVVLTTLHAGGKFNNNSYKVSGGLHGVGISVVNALSEWLKLEIHRDGKIYQQEYRRGVPQNELTVVGKTKRSGTTITFLPDSTIFEITEFKFETLAHRLQESAYLNNNLKLILIDLRGEEPQKVEFKYEGGIVAFVEHLNQSRDLLHKDVIYVEKQVGDKHIQVAFQYNDGYNERIYSFANNINTVDGGYHVTGFKSALTKALNTWGKNNNILKSSDPSLTGNDVREGLTAVINVKLPNPQFEGQTKAKLGNSEMRSIVETIVYDYLGYYFDTNPEVAKTIIEKALQAVRNRKALKKARELARRKSALNSHSLPGKLADCSSRKAEKSEIFLVEGDSAGGSAKQGRDRQFQAVLPLKGKILNVEKSRLDKILSNNEIATIIAALGCGIGEEFDISKLRYHKIIIMTDADVDGAHICTLLLTLFYRYMKPLIDGGYVYIAQPPLYKVTHGKKETYLYSDEQLKKYLKEIGNVKYTVQRYKGLGEMNPSQLWETTMNPETRRLQVVEIEDELEADEIFAKLMGSNADLRREFIMKNAEQVEELDI